MKNNIKSLSITAMFVLLWMQSIAQLTVQTTVVPPYSPYLSDYVAFNNKVIITINNPTQQMRQVKLMGALTGNGINISTKPGFQPAVAIQVPPGVKQVTGAELNPYFNTNNLNIQGINPNELVQGNGLPEGNYTLCFYAADYVSGSPLSPQNGGCTQFNISHYEAPFLLQPICGGTVQKLMPQNMLFSWTVPAGANPINIEYELTIAEMFPQQIDPNQALDVATEPIFFRKTVQINNYLYSQIDPPLEAGKKYAWRIRAKPRPGKTANFKNNGISQACAFTYEENENNQNNQVLPPDDPSCIASCDVPEPQNKSPYNPQVNDEISIGLFSMSIKTISGSNGTGIIRIPFMGVNLLVDFSGLQVNTDKQAFGTTKAIAKIEGNNLVDQAIANDPNGDIQMTRDKYNSINNYVNQGQRLMSKFNPEMQPIGVPFAMDNKGMNLQIVGLIFTPTKAYMNSIFGYDMAEWFGNEFVDFSQKGICIRPNGYGVAPKFSLKSDRTISVSDHAEMLFKKGEGTFVEISCMGIEKVKLSGEYLISRQKILPVQNDKIVEGNARAKAPFSIEVNDGGYFIVETNLQPATFTIPDAEDFRFAAQNIVLDMHGTQNPQGVQFHQNHPKKNGNNADWMGLYIKQLTVTLPVDFKKGNNNISLSSTDLMLDKTGFWAAIQANNLMTLAQGTVGNWQFSISSFGLNIEASALAGGSMKGDIRIPIAETALGYDCMIHKGNNGIDYQFKAETQNDLEAGLWLAKIKLEPGSSVKIEKQNNVIAPEAILNGTISIAFTQSPNQQTPMSNLSLNGIKFQELKVSGVGQKPTINLSFVSLQNQPNGLFSMSKFPINLTNLAYDNGANPGLIFGLKVNLSKGTNAFQAETNLKVAAQWNNGQKKFEFKGIELQSIDINADLGVMAVVGSIDLYKEHETYGTGFRGDIEATLKFASVAIFATVQMGKIGDSDPVQETNTNYRYFFIDIGARWGVGGLPIPGVGAVAFYGFGGGIYRNMDRNSPNVVTNDMIPDNQGAGTMNPGESRSGVIYTPKKGTFGFMASVTLGATGEPTSFNADLKLTVQFNTDNFGVTQVVFEGDAYIMGPIDDRNQRLLQVSVEIISDFEMPMFHAAVTVEGGFDQSKLNIEVTVKASLNIHFEPGFWYVKLGEWTNQDEPWNDPKRIQIDANLGNNVVGGSLNFNAYFMMGNDIGHLPLSPLKVRTALNKQGKADVPNTPNEKVYLGTGFALGAGVRLVANLNYSVFYANLEFILGGDIVLSKTNALCNGKSDYGINGWYARGQAYAYLNGDVGIRLKLWGFQGNFSFLEFDGAALMKAEMPNPNWIKGDFYISGSVLNGLIEVNTNFGFEVGEKCQWSDQNMDEIPLISEMLPENKTDGSVFEAPQAAFNFTTHEPGKGVSFNVKDYTHDKKGKTRTFKIELVSVTLKMGNVHVPGNYHFNNAKNGITFMPANTLEENKDHSFTVIARAFELVNGNWIIRRTQTETTKFKTGIKPDYIAEQNLISAYPQIGQRYFLPKDEPKGDIRVGLSQCYLLNKKEDKDFVYNYIIRFTNLETKQSFEVPFTCNEKNFTYNMPQGLTKETVYEVRYLRVATPKKGPANTKTNTKMVYKNLQGVTVEIPPKPGNMINMNAINNKIKNNNNYQYNNKIKMPGGGGGGMQNMNLNIKNNAPNNPNMLLVRNNTVKEQQATGGKIEKTLLEYYFRTSKHNTAQEKYDQNYSHAGMGQQYYSGTVIVAGKEYTYATDVKFPLLQGAENMDSYDAYGYYKENFNIKVEPLARLGLVWGDNNYYQKLNTRIYERKYKGKNITSYSFAQNRYGKGNIYFFGLNKQLFSRQPLEAIKVWHSSTEGPINLNANQEIMQPKGKLSQSEINKAKLGQKIVDINPKNPVLPLNVYLPVVAYLDAATIYNNHRSRCLSDHPKKVLDKKDREDCIKNQALPALEYFPSTTWPNYIPYNLMPNLNYNFNIWYGYLSDKPFHRVMTFKTN